MSRRSQDSVGFLAFLTLCVSSASVAVRLVLSSFLLLFVFVFVFVRRSLFLRFWFVFWFGLLVGWFVLFLLFVFYRTIAILFVHVRDGSLAFSWLFLWKTAMVRYKLILALTLSSLSL